MPNISFWVMWNISFGRTRGSHVNSEACGFPEEVNVGIGMCDVCGGFWISDGDDDGCRG